MRDASDCTTFCSTNGDGDSIVAALEQCTSSPPGGVTAPNDGSSRMSSFGSDISPRSMASVCCSPPESEPAIPALGEARQNLPGALAVAGALRSPASKAAELEVLAHREVGQDAAALRARMRPSSTTHRACVRDVLAIEPHAAEIGAPPNLHGSIAIPAAHAPCNRFAKIPEPLLSCSRERRRRRT